MRLLTWNARRGRYLAKMPSLDHFDADVLVVPEIAAPAHESAQVLWFGDNPHQGLAVAARKPYALRRLPLAKHAPKFVVPVAVDGPQPFLLFAVWTLGLKPLPYVRAACAAVDLYAQLFRKGPVVMMGDFNSNAIWDGEHPPDASHSALVARLRGHGLVSAYHHFHGVAHGREPKAGHTFYLYGHEEKSFHLDYCFVPKAWACRIQNVSIGGYHDWKAHSDHRPVLVDLQDAHRAS